MPSSSPCLQVQPSQPPHRRGQPSRAQRIQALEDEVRALRAANQALNLAHQTGAQRLAPCARPAPLGLHLPWLPSLTAENFG